MMIFGVHVSSSINIPYPKILSTWFIHTPSSVMLNITPQKDDTAIIFMQNYPVITVIISQKCGCFQHIMPHKNWRPWRSVSIHFLLLHRKALSKNGINEQRYSGVGGAKYESRKTSDSYSEWRGHFGSWAWARMCILYDLWRHHFLAGITSQIPDIIQ